MFYITNHPFDGSPMGPFESAEEAFAEICSLGLQECECVTFSPGYHAWKVFGTVDPDGQHLCVYGDKELAKLKKLPGQRLCWVNKETYTNAANDQLEVLMVHVEPDKNGEPWIPLTYKNGILINGKPVKGEIVICYESYSPESEVYTWFRHTNEGPLRLAIVGNDGWHCSNDTIKISGGN